MKPYWLAIGRTSDNTVQTIRRRSAASVTREGRALVESGAWLSFRVAKVTAEYERGAVRL